MMFRLPYGCLVYNGCEQGFYREVGKFFFVFIIKRHPNEMGFYRILDFLRLLSPCISTITETCLPRMEATVKVLDVKVSQKRCKVLFDVFYVLPMLYSQLFLQLRKQTTTTKKAACIFPQGELK